MRTRTSRPPARVRLGCCLGGRACAPAQRFARAGRAPDRRAWNARAPRAARARRSHRSTCLIRPDRRDRVPRSGRRVQTVAAARRQARERGQYVGRRSLPFASPRWTPISPAASGPGRRSTQRYSSVPASAQTRSHSRPRFARPAASRIGCCSRCGISPGRGATPRLLAEPSGSRTSPRRARQIRWRSPPIREHRTREARRRGPDQAAA